MKPWMLVILTAGLSTCAAGQLTAASLPVSVDGAYEVAGFDGMKPHVRGMLTFSADTIQFASARAAVTVPIGDIARYGLDTDSREIVPGASGAVLQTLPLLGLVNPLVEAGAMASGLGAGMLRKGVSTLEFEYADANHGLHKAVFLLPPNGGDSARDALASLNVPTETAGPAPHPAFSKNAKLLSSSVVIGKGVGSIRVASLAGEGGMPPSLEALIYEQLVSQLKSSGYFRYVLRAGEDVPSGGTGELVTLQTSINGFAEGKPRLRLATIGFGKGRITAEARVSDNSSTLLRDNIVNINLGGDQSSSDGCRLLASRVAHLVTASR